MQAGIANLHFYRVIFSGNRTGRCIKFQQIVRSEIRDAGSYLAREVFRLFQYLPAALMSQSVQIEAGRRYFPFIGNAVEEAFVVSIQRLQIWGSNRVQSSVLFHQPV